MTDIGASLRRKDIMRSGVSTSWFGKRRNLT